jgi:hypothetical protein
MCFLLPLARPDLVLTVETGWSLPTESDDTDVPSSSLSLTASFFVGSWGRGLAPLLPHQRDPLGKNRRYQQLCRYRPETEVMDPSLPVKEFLLMTLRISAADVAADDNYEYKTRLFVASSAVFVSESLRLC